MSEKIFKEESIVMLKIIGLIINMEEYDKIVLLAKTKFSSTKVLNSKALIDPCISHDESVSVNNVLREYDAMKEEIRNPINR